MSSRKGQVVIIGTPELRLIEAGEANEIGPINRTAQTPEALSAAAHSLPQGSVEVSEVAEV